MIKIAVISSVGTGKTLLSAFDAALNNAGVSNYNLLVLSSVIPPNSVIKKIKKYTTPPDEFGHKLYVVRAEMRSNEAKKWLAAGVGWYQLEDGRGLFVEHELVAETRMAAKTDLELLITNSLHDLCHFRDIPFHSDKIHMQTSIAQVKDKPMCVLVIAVYQSEGWK
jgi:arginine decarboxylase